MATFGNVALINERAPNQLLDLASVDQDINKTRIGRVVAETGVQDLADRATMRGLAPAIQANDPAAGATMLSLSAPTQASANFANMRKDERDQLGMVLALSGSLSGAILAAPPEQRSGLYQQFLPIMERVGAKGLPAAYPGDEAVNAHRIAATSVQEQLKLLENVPTTDPMRTPLSLPAGPRVGAGAGTFVDRVIGAESGGDPNAANPRSSARGAGQFIDSTWLSMIRQGRPDLATGKSDAEVLALRSDPTLSRQMVEAYAKQNGEALQGAGLPVNDGTLYVAHMFGPGGAQALLSAPPNTPIESVVGAQAVAANPFLRGMTAGQAIERVAGKMGGSRPVQVASAAGAAGLPQTATDAVSSIPGANPLLAVAGSAPGARGVNQLMSVAAPERPQMLYRGNLPIPAGPQGYVATRQPDGGIGMTRLPGAPAEDVKLEKQPDGSILVYSKDGQFIRRDVPPADGPAYSGNNLEGQSRNILLDPKIDTASERYRQAYAQVGAERDVGGKPVRPDMSMFRAPTLPATPSTEVGASPTTGRDVGKMVVTETPTAEARTSVRKAEVEVDRITSAIDRFEQEFKAQGGSGASALMNDPRNPQAQKLLGAYESMKATLRSESFLNTGVLQPAEAKMLDDMLLSPQTLRGAMASPEAMTARLGEYRAMVNRGLDAQRRAAGVVGAPTKPAAEKPTEAPARAAPAGAIAHLKANPALAAAFDAKFGAGAAQRALAP